MNILRKLFVWALVFVGLIGTSHAESFGHLGSMGRGFGHLGGAGKTSGGGGSQQPVTFVATGGIVPNSNLAVSTATPYHINRIPIVFGGPVTQVALAFDNWVINSSGDLNNTAQISIDKVSLEVGGQSFPILFSGGRSKLLNPGDNAIISDFLSISLPRDTIAWVRVGCHYATTPGGTFLPVGDGANPLDGGGRYSSTQGQYIDQVDAVGVLQSPLGADVQPSSVMFGPSAILGRYAAPGYLAIYHIGDSITVGLGNTKPLYFTGVGSFATRSATLFAGTINTHAVTVAALSGDTAQSYLNSPKRQAYLQYANVLTDSYLTNDLGTAGTVTLANLQNLAGQVWTSARNAGISKIVRTYLLPRVGSTDNWATLVNQSVVVLGWDVGGISTQFNTWVATQVGVTIDAICPFVTARDATTPTLWPVNGTPFFSTPDGVHPDVNIAMGQELRAVYNALPNNTHTNDAAVSFGTQTETQTLTQKMNIYPGAARVTLIDNLIIALKAAGVWSKMDLLRIYAANDTQAARLNWLDPTKYISTIVGLPIFTVDRGYTGNGSTRAINEVINPTNAGLNVQQNSAHVGAWARSGGSGWVFGEQNLRVSVGAGGGGVFQVNDGSGGTVTGSGTFGHYVGSRSASANYTPYYRGAAGTLQSIASAAISNNTMMTLEASNSFSPAQVSAVHFGSSLTGTDASNLYTALQTYMHAIGAD